MLEYIWNAFVSPAYLPLFMQVFILMIAVTIDSYIQKNRKRIMGIIIVLILSFIVDNILSDYLIMEASIPFARALETMFVYIFRPVLIVVCCHLVQPERKHAVAWCIAGVNAFINLSALFCPIVFSITPNNRFERGPLGYTVHVSSTILIAYFAFLSIREWRHKRRAEALIPIVTVLLIVIAFCLDSFIICTQQGVTYLTAALVSATLFYYVWLHLQLAREHEEELVAKQRVQIMVSQIQPHFLYNTLGAIRAICDNPKAKEAVGYFTRYLQGNMDVLSKPGLIPFSVELEHTKAYLELEQLRYEEALRVEYDITCTDFVLPTLTLQPIAENAVRHGARGTEKEVGTVVIRTVELPECYEVIVTDDGPGFDPQHPVTKDDGRAHIGLQNVRGRLHDVCGGELRIESEMGKGTKVTLVLPKNAGKGPR